MMDAKEFSALEKYFYDHMWPIYPYGEDKLGANSFAWIIKRNTLWEGEPLTPERLVELYSEYVQSLNQFQAGKFTKAEHRIKDPYKWLNNKGWEARILNKIDPLDRYLFGDMLDE
jgi:hypothetical protein